MKIKLVSVIAIAAALLLAASLGYKFGHDSVMSDWQKERAEVNKATADAIIKMRDQSDELERELKNKEAEAWELYKNAEKESERLNDELVNRPWRLRIVREPADCPMHELSGATGLDDGAGNTAELPAETTRSLVEIGRDADRCEAKLSGLQSWVDEVVNKK